MKNSSTTPMMSQYIKIKAQYSDALLFYRMGDFYELFFEDAEVAAATLNITLTKRGKHNGLDIPMCGVPYHSSETYLLNLIRSGFKVAICEQLETPEEAKKRGYKAVVNRNVVRLITPGTITEDGLLNKSQNNFLLSWKEENGFCGVAWADISTGELFCSKLTKLELPSLINRVLPSEILCKVEAESDSHSFGLDKKVMVSTLPDQNFDPTISKKRLAKYFDIISTAIFGDISLVEECAIGALISYLEITQFNEAPILTLPKREKSDLFMKIDIASRKNLEITESLHGKLDGSLLGAVDQTLTSGGSRVLQNRLKCPEKNVKEIINRQDTIAFFVSHRTLLREIRQIIIKSPDMQRSLSRLNLKRGSPRDLIVIKNCLRIMLSCVSLLDSYSHPILLKNIYMALKGFDDLSLLLSSALVESPPPTLKEGNFIKSEYDFSLKEARQMKTEAQHLIIKLQRKYIELTKTNSLKIKFNNVLGYFIETPISQIKKMMSDEYSSVFIHRQTTTNSVRFSTLELGNLAESILNASEKSQKLELDIFGEIVAKIKQKTGLLVEASDALSNLDFFTSLSFLSTSLKWTRPQIDNSKAFIIRGGRHPVVELALKNSGDNSFISNNCDLSEKPNNILIVTGPNMAGKSTFLRQNALISILAQIGSYVPCDFAHIGVIDQIFSRVGSSDDLSKGQSTFMVEMIETASILQNATNSALIIMDEVGRGTSTYDGLSLAWSILEHIHDKIKSRTIFATHYHELTQLEKFFPQIRNAKVAIREWKDEVVFLHEVKFGKADKSYGIQVAKLAGLPSAVISRAEVILSNLEENAKKIDVNTISAIDKTKNPENQLTNKEVELIDFLLSINTDEITPKEALSLLDKMVQSLGEGAQPTKIKQL